MVAGGTANELFRPLRTCPTAGRFMALLSASTNDAPFLLQIIMYITLQHKMKVQGAVQTLPLAKQVEGR